MEVKICTCWGYGQRRLEASDYRRAQSRN